MSTLTSNRTNYFELLLNTNNDIMYAKQVMGLIYISLCIFWIVYAICDLISKIRDKRKLVALKYSEMEYDHVNRHFLLTESILRNCIFLAFLCFELVYGLIFNVYEFLFIFYSPNEIAISIYPNCTLASGTFLSNAYDISWRMFLSRFFGLFIQDISFSMLIWMFGASLLHLSYAAKNKLNAKAILCFTLIGLIISLISAVPIMVPYTSLLGNITQSVVDQIVFFLVLYIANRKFIPAMNSRVIDAFHFNNKAVYLQQKRLLSRYKALIYFLLLSFELYILKDLFLYNLYIIFESICANSCWFRVTLTLPAFTISSPVDNFLIIFSEFLLLLAHLIDLIFYFNTIAINLIFIFITSQRCIKRMNFYNKKRYCYRYRVFSAPLLSQH